MVERRNLAARTWRFPVERSEDYKGTITFRPVRYTPPEISGSDLSALATRTGDNGLRQLLNNNTDTTIATDTTDDARASRTNASLDVTSNTNETIVSASTTSVDRTRGVVLYLPANIIVNDAVDYENFDLGPIGAIGAAGIRSGQGAISALARGVDQAAGSLASLLRDDVADQRGARLAAARLAELTPDAFGGAVAAGAVRSSLAATVNPNTINIFKSVQLRQFSFTFKMIANSAREAEEIDNIIKFFRATMYPDTINFDPDGLSVPIGYEFPDKFQIEMRYNGEQVGIRILNSVLKQVQTSYNPQSMSWHKDGKPSEVDITVSFGEERTLNRNDILEGY